MYIAIDGDEVGKRLEYLIFCNNVENIVTYSKLIAAELIRISSYLKKLNYEIIFSGGDSILAVTAGESNVDLRILNENGITWSVGIGDSPSHAALALKKAKALGRSRIEFF